MYLCARQGHREREKEREEEGEKGKEGVSEREVCIWMNLSRSKAYERNVFSLTYSNTRVTHVCKLLFDREENELKVFVLRKSLCA